MSAEPVAKLFKCIACHGRIVEVYEGEGENERLVKRRDDGNHDPARCHRLRTAYLAYSFHGLREAPGLTPWDPAKLARWVRGGAFGHGSQCAGKFVLSVWNASYFNRGPTRFDVIEALGCWDDRHRDAFLAWAARPWWP